MSVAKLSKAFGSRVKFTKVIKQRPKSDEENSEEEEEEEENDKGASVQPLVTPDPLALDPETQSAFLTVDDMVLLPQQEVAEKDIVQCLGTRFMQDKIYTYIGPVLVALNPFKLIHGLYSEGTLRSYFGAKNFQKAPHVFALADAAYNKMMQTRSSQCVIISGESGAGKTETSKFIIQYINGVSGGRSEVARTKQRLQASNPILEGFGNAKTINNNNSSRFGKFMKILFDPYGDPIGGAVVNYLLEKSRVVCPGKNERNFHVFYQLCLGASGNDRQAFNVLDPEEYYYLSSSNCLNVPGVNDAADWLEMLEAFQAVGLSRVHRDDVLRTLSAILWLGNVSFIEKSDEVAEVEDEGVLKVVASLLQVEYDLLRTSLITRRIVTGSGEKAEVFIKPNTIKNADLHRDTLAKALYSKLFDFMVKIINEALKVDPAGPARRKKRPIQEEVKDADGDEVDEAGVKIQKNMYIAVLDIYGFESFPFNSFEQICINFVNEKLQQIFIELTLETEQAEYAQEGLPWRHIPYNDNKPLCELIEGKPGLLSICDDCCATNKTDLNFSMDLKNFFGNSAKLTKYIRVNQNDFMIHHYAGKVTYQFEDFLAKNKDTLFDDLIIMMQKSKCNLARDHGWLDIEVQLDQVKKRPVTVGYQFKQQVALLMKELHMSNQYYIRCIKTNTVKKANIFDVANVTRQVQYLGLLENIQVRRAGYAYRNKFELFIQRYRVLSKRINGGQEEETDPRKLCVLLCEEIGWQEGKEYVLGKTKIFLSDAKALYVLEDKIRVREESAASVIQRIYRRFKCSVFFRVIKSRAYELVKGRKDRRRASICDRYVGDHINATYNQQIQDVLQANSYARFPGTPRLPINTAASLPIETPRNVEKLAQTFDAVATADGGGMPVNESGTISLAKDQASFASGQEKLLFADRVKLIDPGNKPSLLGKLFASRNKNRDGKMESSAILILTTHAIYCMSVHLKNDGVAATSSASMDIEPSSDPSSSEPPTVTELDFRVPLRYIESMAASPFADDYVLLHYSTKRRGMPSDSLVQMRHKTEFFALMVEAQGQLNLGKPPSQQFDLSIKERDEMRIRGADGRLESLHKVKWLPDDSAESGLAPGGNYRCDVRAGKVEIHVSSGVPFREVPIPNKVGSLDTYVPGPPSLRCLYDYRASDPEMELSFARGQSLTMLRDVNNGWYYAEDPVTKNQGKVPCSYVIRMKRPCMPGEEEPRSIQQLLGAPLNVCSAPWERVKTPKATPKQSPPDGKNNNLTLTTTDESSDGDSEERKETSAEPEQPAPVHPNSTRSERCQVSGCAKKRFGERDVCVEHMAQQNNP